MANENDIAILKNYREYGFKTPTLGFVSPGLTFAEEKRVLSFRDGIWV